MKNKIVLSVVLLSICSTLVYALSSNFSFDTSKLSFTTNSKKKNVISNFNNSYNLSYSLTNENKEIEKKINNLTKKTTYLLFGNFNNNEESIENYYKRKKDFYDLRYNPNIPKDANNITGFDVKSQEYIDDIVSGMAIPQIFSQASELGLIYNSYGDIRVSLNSNFAISSITLPNVKLKEESKINQMEYEYKETNFVMHYYFKKLGDEWKLYYLYGEDTDDIGEYFNEIETNESKIMSVVPTYKSQLEQIYSFKKLNTVSKEELNDIYNNNISNILFLNSYYNNIVIASSNGFFINNGLVVTTWNFLEKSLVNAQYITIRGNDKTYEIDGVVTANPDTDVAVLKIKDVSSKVKLGNYKQVQIEDPVITISSKIGTGLIVQTGILTSKDGYLQTSIPLSNTDEGSPLFNINGEVIGFNTSKSTKNSISIAINADVLKEIQNKFNTVDIDEVETISFKELKENYYYIKYNNEKIQNTIPKSKWNKYSIIGNVENAIKLELIKASYKDGIVSLRYKNSISKYINGMQLAIDYKENLIKSGYTEILNSPSKCIYKNKDYQVIIMDEFDYLIIVMVKL